MGGSGECAKRKLIICGCHWCCVFQRQMWLAVATHDGVQRALRSFMTTSILSSPFLAWTHTKHSTPVRSLQQSNWTRFGTFHATCTHNALCLLLFTYAGHHNNSFAKCCFNQLKFDPGPKFDTLDHSSNAISLFQTSLCTFLRLKFHFVGPESGPGKKSLMRTNTQHRTDLSSIWGLPGPTFKTRKLVIFREIAQIGVPDRTLWFC